MKFRKKPVVIEAVQFEWTVGRNPSFNEPCPMWLVSALNEPDRSKEGAVWPDGDELRIRSLEGVMEVSPRDWIIRGVKGELYPCKPDIFEQTYETA